MGRALVLLLLLAASATPRAAEPLGRLFFTPERRAMLERQRQAGILETQTLEAATLRLDGVVVRSGGRRTVWINGRPQHENETATGVGAAVAPGQPGRARIVAGDEAAADLDVGVSIDRTTRERDDGIAGGRIQVHHPPEDRGRSRQAP